MKKDKSFGSVLALLIIAVLVVGGFSYYIGKLNVSKNQLTAQLINFGRPDLTPTQQAPSPTTLCLAGGDPSITVIAPNGGETYFTDKPFQIKWASCNIPLTSMLTVSVVYNGSTPVPFVNPTSQNSGLYNNYIISSSRINTESWKYGLNYKIKVSLLNNPAVSDTSDKFFAINNPNSDIVYVTSNGVGGVSGAIIKSTDSGNTWQVISKDSLLDIPVGITISRSGDIYLINKSMDAPNYFDSIFKSSDNGVTWKVLNSIGSNSFFMNSIATSPVGDIYVPSNGNISGHILKSTDKGVTWQSYDKSSYFMGGQSIAIDSSGIIYMTENLGTSANPSGRILKSTDSGSTWKNPTNSGVFKMPYGIAISPSGVMYVVNYQNNTILKSTDNGVTWKDTTNGGAFKWPKAIAISPTGVIYVVNGGDYTILKSYDNGATWQKTSYNSDFGQANGIAIK